MNSSWALDGFDHVDQLQRTPFCRHLLDLVRSVSGDCGVIVGLEGSWGSGKTWVLRRLPEMSEDNEKRPLFLHFNPWLVSGTNDLVFALLDQLGRQIHEAQGSSRTGLGRTALTKAAKAIERYAGAIAATKHVAPALELAVPGMGLALTGIAATAEKAGDAAKAVIPALGRSSKKSLLSLRADVESGLRRLGRTIVVTVDDLDRIAPAEIASMVQAVKAVADFPNVVYLLAYDPELVSRALQRALRVPDGRGYLEKIVQLPITLPELPARRIQAFAEHSIRGAVEHDELSTQERDDLDQATTIAAALMQTPRDVLRLRALLQWRAPRLRGEVNLADVAVAEAIALKVPQFLSRMRVDGLLLLTAGVAEYDSTQTSRGMHAPARLSIEATDDEAEYDSSKVREEFLQLGTLDGAARVAYQRALQYLFSGAAHSWRPERKRSSYLPMQRFRHWYRWLCLCDSQEPIEASQLQHWAASPSELLKTEWVTSAAAFETVSMLLCDLDNASVPQVDAGGWVDVFARLANPLGTKVLVGFGNGFGQRHGSFARCV